MNDRGVSSATVLPAGRRLYLNDIPLGTEGADLRDATHEVPEPVRAMAIKACQALGVEVAGLDVIIDENGRGVILEANQNPLIHGNVFPRQTPSPGNRVAEAIIDHYFPGSIDNPRHVKASFDFMQVCRTLQNGTVGEVTLPVLGPDWVHRRFSIAATQVDERTEPAIRSAMFTYGIHAQLIRSDVGDLIVDVVAPESRYNTFLTALRGK